MARRIDSLAVYLRDLLAGLSGELPEVHERRMFGCDAFFAQGSIFGLISDGRVALKIPQEERFRALANLPGSEPWSPIPGAKPMSHWLLVPEDLHDDPEGLRPWVELAHRSALTAPKKAAKKRAAALKSKASRTPVTRRRR